MLMLIKGLEKLLPDAIFKGDLRTNDIDLYEALKLIDEDLTKPTYEEVYEAALNVYRKEKTEEVNDKTTDLIINDFTLSTKPDLIFHLDLQFQFNVQTLYSQKNYLPYPYNLKISSSDNGLPVMMLIADTTEFDTFHIEALTHIQTCIHIGVAEKNKITAMNEEELNNYIDPR